MPSPDGCSGDSGGPPSKGLHSNGGRKNQKINTQARPLKLVIIAEGSNRGNWIENYLQEMVVLCYSEYRGVVGQYWNADYLSNIKMLEM